MEAMAGNPAWDRLLQSQAVLVLQGPVGPLLAKLTLKLAKNGKVVRRVVFNAGDQQNASTHPSSLLHPFKGPMENLPNWFRNLCVKHGIETVVLFGQSRPCHAAVIPVAKALGITVLVMEEGYFRPGYLTLEMDGVNGHSATLDRFVWQPSAQTISTLNPHECKHHFFKTAVHAIRYYLAMFMGQRAFPHYVHHRETSPTWYVRYWLKSWITQWRRFGQDHDQHQALVKMGPPYFLIPLQHDGDAQITHHSSYSNNQAFIKEVVRSFALHAKPTDVLLFKEHPMSRGGQLSDAWIAACAREFGIESRAMYLVEGHNPSLIAHAQGVVVINSTIGLQAIEHRKPIKVMGQSLYDRPGLTFQGSLDAFWRSPTAPNAEVSDEFLTQLKRLTQVPCSIYANAHEPWRALSQL